MIIYNVTVTISNDAHDEWLQWMKDTHIPDVMTTGHFIESNICRVIDSKAEEPTYAIQYKCKDMATLHQYQVQHAPQLQKEHTERYEGKFAAFRTLLEVIHEQ